MYEQPINKEVLYRAYGWVDYDYYGRLREVQIRYDEFPVTRHTPCGVWIDLKYGEEKWVSLSSRKRYAYPTKEEALNSLRKRNRRYIQQLNMKLEKAEAIRNLLEAKYEQP